MSDPRDDVANALRGYLTQETLDKLLGEVLASTKRVRVAGCSQKGCPCKHIRYEEIPDAAAAVKGVTDLLNQGFGRPAQESDDDHERITFVYELVVDSADDAPASLQADAASEDLSV